jgi:hypothetical protein
MGITASHAVIEQGTLFPLVEEVAGERSWLRDFIDAVEQHGPLVFRAHVSLVLDVSRQRVHELIEKNQLATVKIRGREYVPVASLEAYFAEEHKNGRPRNIELRWLHRLTDRQKKLQKVS